MIFSNDGLTMYAISPGSGIVFRMEQGSAQEVLASGFEFPDAIAQGPGNASGRTFTSQTSMATPPSRWTPTAEKQPHLRALPHGSMGSKTSYSDPKEECMYWVGGMKARR